MEKKIKGKRKNLLKKDPSQEENLTYEKKVGLTATVNPMLGKVEPEKKEEPKKVFYNNSRPKTAFNMRKRVDQTN